MNPQLNYLKGSTSESVYGWTFNNVTEGPWTQTTEGLTSERVYEMTNDNFTEGPWNQTTEAAKADCSTKASWFGWTPYQDASISTKFQGKGNATLRFGNCFDQGQVFAHLNNEPITSVQDGIPQEVGVGAKTEMEIEFEFHDGDELKIFEANDGIIQFNNLAIVGCAPGMDQYS